MNTHTCDRCNKSIAFVYYTTPRTLLRVCRNCYIKDRIDKGDDIYFFQQMQEKEKKRVQRKKKEVKIETSKPMIRQVRFED